MIRIGLIGLGKMGISHCAILNSHKDVALIAVCDSSTFLLEAFNKYSKMKTYTDYKKMIHDESLDAVLIATPTIFHAEMVEYSLSHGLHVFCEKPFSLNVTDGARLTDLAKSKKLVNQVGYHNRFIGTFIEMKRLLEVNILGDLIYFKGSAYGPVVLKEKGDTWRSSRENGGGCLFDYASHVLNLIDFIIDTPVTPKGTILKSIYSNNVDDAVYSTLFLKNGLGGQLSVNWSDETHRKMTTSLEIEGKKGKMVADATELKIYLKEDIGSESLNKGWNIKYITDLTALVDFNLRGEEYTSQIDYFVQSILSGNLENKNSFEVALNTDKIIAELIKDNLH